MPARSIITHITKDVITLNVARENPKILKVTSLQLTLCVFNSFKRSCVEVTASILFKLQTKDSLKKPCSMPKW